MIDNSQSCIGCSQHKFQDLTSIQKWKNNYHWLSWMSIIIVASLWPTNNNPPLATPMTSKSRCTKELAYIDRLSVMY